MDMYCSNLTNTWWLSFFLPWSVSNNITRCLCVPPCQIPNCLHLLSAKDFNVRHTMATAEHTSVNRWVAGSFDCWYSCLSSTQRILFALHISIRSLSICGLTLLTVLRSPHPRPAFSLKLITIGVRVTYAFFHTLDYAQQRGSDLFIKSTLEQIHNRILLSHYEKWHA